MSKHNRTEVIRILRQQMEAATDPQTKVDLAKQLAKLLPKPRQARRPRKPAVATSAPPSNKKVSILDRVTGSAVDNLSDGGKVLNYIVVEIEKRQRERKQTFTEAERDALREELMASLSARERAAPETQNEINAGC